jgi:hypothetical protein
MVGLFPLPQMGVYTLSSSVVCTFFMRAAAAAIDATSMVLTALGQTEHKVASDIVWTMDLGVGMD